MKSCLHNAFPIHVGEEHKKSIGKTDELLGRLEFHKCENASFWYDGVPAIVVVQRTCEATAGMPSHQKHAPRFKDDLAFEGLVTLN